MTVATVRKRVILSMILLGLLGSFFYLSESTNDLTLPKQVGESSRTIDNVNSMRFAFKTSLLTHQATILYAKAIIEDNPDLIQEAVDNIDAAIAFISILERNAASNADVIAMLNEIRALILDSYSNNIIAVEQLVTKIHTISEKREREVWTEVQREYMTQEYQEYKSVKTYQIITATSALILLIALYQIIKSFRFSNSFKSKEKQLKDLAYKDSMTGLPNYHTFEIELSRYAELAQNKQLNGSLALINIDNFKNLNNTHGRLVANEVIKSVASKILDVIGHLGNLFHLEGDEFAIIFPAPTEPKEVLKRVIRIHEGLRAPLKIQNQEYKVTVSIGIAGIDGSQTTPTSSQDLIRNADLALRSAKQDGKNCFHSFNEQMVTTLEQDETLLDELQHAINNEQFELYYQPLFSTQEHRITTLEALVRWHHPKKGILLPDNFIKELNQSHLAQEFSEWVICRAIEQQHLWKSQNIDAAISLNLPVHLLSDNDFVARLKLITDSLNADLGQIYFEISNFCQRHDHPKLVSALNQLSDQGYQFYLDDFGSDNSPISILETLPLVAIKIDKSLTQDIGQDKSSQLMVRGVVLVAQARRLKVIAEGVETKEQVALLSELKCDYLQGYLIAKPQPEQAITKLLLKHHKTK